MKSSRRQSDHYVAFEPSPKRVRAMVNGKTVAASLCTGLVFETGHHSVYYFPSEDVRMDLLERTNHSTQCPHKGDASYWTLKVGNRSIENALWSYEQPRAGIERIKGLLAFEWDKVDHWFEEDEEIFGHARDPYHRFDVRPSSREIRAMFAGETIALSRRGLFVFETGLPTRYYIPPGDVRTDFLVPTRKSSTCPYKGRASYWTVQVGDRTAEDAVWSYPEPLPECPRIRGHLCFYPEKMDGFEVEGEGPHVPRPA